jgi:hypothetical protein
MIITSNRRSQQTPSAKGKKRKIQRLDRVSCPDTEIQVLPNLGIAMDLVSCSDTNIGVLTTRFPRASCFKEIHAFCSRNMGVHVQCTYAKKLVSSNFAKIIHNYVRKKMLSRLAISGNVWGGSTSLDVLAVHNYDLKKKCTVFWFFGKKRTVIWPSVGMIITSNGHSQQSPSAKGGKGKIQRLDRVSCPDTEIRVLPIWELPWTGLHVLTQISEF